MERTVLNYLLVAFLINTNRRTLGQKIDITAFEYTRKVRNNVEIGHCVSKMEELFPGSIVEKRCTLAPKRDPIRYVSKELNDTRSFEVQNYNDIFVCMGLCDGYAASALGLLHKGDCFAVEIAGKLTFSQKTYIQAYTEYFRSGIDIQQTTGFPPQALLHYYNGHYFLRDRSYGTMEIIILEMRFPKRKQVETLRRTRRQFQQMSSFIQNSIAEVGEPSSIKLIRLSTAKEVFELLHYKRNKLDDVFSKLQQYESDIFHVREDIRRNYIKPHLRYGMFPYTHKRPKRETTTLPTENPMLADLPPIGGCSQGTSRKSSNHIQWEEACVVEVHIDTFLKRQKRLVKKCKTIPVEQCSNLTKIKKSLKKVKVDVHSQRAKWHQLTNSERKKVKTAKREIRKLSKELGVIANKIKEISKLRKRSRNSNKRSKKQRKSK